MGTSTSSPFFFYMHSITLVVDHLTSYMYALKYFNNRNYTYIYRYIYIHVYIDMYIFFNISAVL